MFKTGIIIFILCFTGYYVWGKRPASAANIDQTKETVRVYLNKKEAAEYLLKSNYYKEQNRLSVSLKTKGAIAYTDENYREDYRKYVESHLHNWTENDIEHLNDDFSEILPVIKRYASKVIQDTIFLIKSDKELEFSAPFTKRKAIVIPDKIVTKNINPVLTHELFHIFSSNHPKDREKLYNLIGFEKINPVQLPDTMSKMLISNPDDNRSNDYKITLQADGKKQDFIMLIFSKYPKYEGRKGLLSKLDILLGYMTIRLVPVVKTNGHWEVAPNAKYYYPGETQGFYEKVSYIHDYMLSPEEILAEDFAKLINLKMKPKSMKRLTPGEKAFFRQMELLLN